MGGVVRRILGVWKVCEVEEVAVRDEEGGGRLEGGLCEEDGERRIQEGRGAPTVFYNESTMVRVVVHGDDFTFSGTKVELDKMRRKMEEWYDIKNRGMV